MGYATFAIFLCGAAGSLAGGFLADGLVNRGYDRGRVAKTMLSLSGLVAALSLLVLPLYVPTLIFGAEAARRGAEGLPEAPALQPVRASRAAAERAERAVTCRVRMVWRLPVKWCGGWRTSAVTTTSGLRWWSRAARGGG